MKLIYIDESGDTGHNLSDPQQPVFVLAAIIVPDILWNTVEEEFEKIIKKYFQDIVPEDFELHVVDMKNRKKHFKNFDKKTGATLRDEVLLLIENLQLKVIYRRVIKKQFQKFCENRFGKGIQISPYLMALSMLWFEINKYLNEHADLGMLIFDENKTYYLDAEKSLKSLRLDQRFQLSNNKLIEKGFFVDSTKSIPLQLTDLVAYYIRKYEEHKSGKPVSEIDQGCFPQIEKLAKMGGMPAEFTDIMKWAKENWK